MTSATSSPRSSHSLAVLFATRLEQRGVPLCSVTAQTPLDIAELLRTGGKTSDDFVLIEAQTIDTADAEQWTVELADRVPLATSEPARQTA